MYKVLMRQTAHDSLREIISYVSTDNPTAAEKLGNELVDQALSLESYPNGDRGMCDNSVSSEASPLFWLPKATN
jgi:plasmid stabilization system protein ParE